MVSTMRPPTALAATAPYVTALQAALPTATPTSLVIVTPIAEWAHAVARGNPGAAAPYRHLLNANDDDLTWEDAEWR